MTIEELKGKNIYIYGRGKVQQDFEYVFDWIKVCGYLQDEREVYEFLNKLSDDNILIVLCKETQNPIESKKVMDVRKLFPVLDEFIANELFDIQHKNLIFWGVGAVYKKLIKNLRRFVSKELPPFCLIDSDPKKKNAYIDGVFVKHPDDIEDWKNAYYIVSTDAYEEIYTILRQKGLTEYEDFISYNKLMSRFPLYLPSEMMNMTCFATPYDYRDCYYPFNRAVAWRNGGVACCCEGIEIDFGNIFKEEPKDLWNSIYAKIIRLSVINKTYSFCNHQMCPYLVGKAHETDRRLQNDIDVAESPEWIQLNIDYTCNLKCTSCRKDIKVATEIDYKASQQIADKLYFSGWLDNASHVSIAGDGEALFSKVYKNLIFEKKLKCKHLTIGSNLNLLTEEMLKMLTDTYQDLSFSVSVDATTEETYNKIRLGGNFTKVMKNIELLSSYKQANRIRGLNLVFVVQKDNYFEMIDFAKLGKRLGAFTIFYAIHNWGTYTEEEFRNVSMIDHEKGRLKDELYEVMKDKIWEEPNIQITEIKNMM